MSNPKDNKAAIGSESALNQALRDVIQDLPDVPTQMKCRRRERVGRAFLLAASFCVAIAAVPLPVLKDIDSWMWVSFALILLLLGGWQIDKASKDEERAARMLGHAQPKRRGALGLMKKLRRVK